MSQSPSACSCPSSPQSTSSSSSDNWDSSLPSDCDEELAWTGTRDSGTSRLVPACPSELGRRLLIVVEDDDVDGLASESPLVNSDLLAACLARLEGDGIGSASGSGDSMSSVFMVVPARVLEMVGVTIWVRTGLCPFDVDRTGVVRPSVALPCDLPRIPSTRLSI